MRLRDVEEMKPGTFVQPQYMLLVAHDNGALQRRPGRSSVWRICNVGPHKRIPDGWRDAAKQLLSRKLDQVAVLSIDLQNKAVREEAVWEADHGNHSPGE